MVDISGKDVVLRVARACGSIKLREGTINLIREGRIPKGDVATATTIAAINAVKETPRLLPYCHPIPVESVKVKMDVDPESSRVKVCVEVKARARTGVEMEALTGVMAALLNVWDMVKAIEKDESGNYPETVIEEVRVVEKVKKPGE
ncbi:cyclic pyranopterin monophosphate synthase MoaC [Stetteria hydrogenophila]